MLNELVEIGLFDREEGEEQETKMKKILLVIFIIGFVYVDHVSGPLLPNNWYCILGAGTYTVTPDSSTCEHKSLWTGWTINETTEKLNKMIKEWGG